MDESLSTTFQQLIDNGLLEIGDGYRAQNSELGGNGPIFLRAGHVTDTHIDFEGVERFHEHLSGKVHSKMSKVGDTVITTKGNSTGRTTVVTERTPPFVYSPHLSYWRTRNPDRLHNGFLRYWSQSREFISQLSAMKTSTDMAPYLSLTDQRRLQITLPPPSRQKSIAHILGSLDEKIELSRQMNITLEAIAQTLFKSWFVDFEPVRRKAEGRPQKPEDALFPDSFEDSTIGDIPLGWTVERVGDVVACVGGSTPSTKEPKFWDDGVHHWTTPKDFSSLQSPILIDTSRKLTNVGLAKISSGLLPAGTLLLSSRAPVGYLAISAIPVAINQGFIAMKCNDRASNYFMLNWCRSNMAEIKSRATGTTFPEISKNSFRPISIVVPKKEIMENFTGQVAPIYAQITANLRQSRTLVSIRDSLLPVLLNQYSFESLKGVTNLPETIQ